MLFGDADDQQVVNQRVALFKRGGGDLPLFPVVTDRGRLFPAGEEVPD